MKITGKLSIAHFLKIGVNLILLVNILTLLFLPFILDFLYENARAQSAESGYSQSAVADEAEIRSVAAIFPENTRWILLSEIPKESYGFMLGFLYFSGIATAMILFLLRKVLQNLQKDIILDHSNARIFKLLSLSCFTLVVSFIIKMIFYNTFLTIFCFFIFIILGLFCLVLSEVFRQGAVVKEENALTI